MWKRLPRQTRERDKQIGNPVLIETTFDGNALDRMVNISDLRSGHDSRERSPLERSPMERSPMERSPLGRQPPANMMTRQSPPPNLQMPPSYNEQVRASTVSSFYSQPSPGFNSGWGGHAPPASPRYADVSPPSSPELSAQKKGNGSNREVSPVDEHPSGSGYPEFPQRQHASHIPVPRKVSSPTGPAATGRAVFRAAAGTGAIRYDAYSGEPTISSAGKAQQVRPGNHTFDATYDGHNPSFGYQASVTTGSHDDKKNATLAAARLMKNNLSVETKPREEWRGASGRAPLMHPPVDKPTKQPFVAPPRTQRKSVQSVSIPRKAISRAETPPVSHGVDNQNEGPIQPIAPLKAERNTPPRGLASPTSPEHAIHPYPSPVTPGMHQRIPQNPYEYPVAPQERTPTPPSATAQRQAHEQAHTPANFSQTQQKDGPEPVSRFSWTTYATTTNQQSPPPSPPPAMPNSSLDYARPVPVQSVPSNPPMSKRPMAGYESINPQGLRAPSVFSTATSNTAKALPRPPPELESGDLIGSLSAQIDDLRLRRNNITRLIDDLTKNQLDNPITMDIVRRREAQKQIKEWEEELAEIGSLEHEAGLRLHRAWKRKEQTEDLEPTTLWVKRITSD